MAPCNHSHIQPDAELHEDLHYEEWHCEDCGALIHGPCHHRSMCRPDFCGLDWPADDEVVTFPTWEVHHPSFPGPTAAGPRF